MNFRYAYSFQIVITGKVGETRFKSSPAIDVISFTNYTCEQLPSGTFVARHALCNSKSRDLKMFPSRLARNCMTYALTI